MGIDTPLQEDRRGWFDFCRWKEAANVGGKNTKSYTDVSKDWLLQIPFMGFGCISKRRSDVRPDYQNQDEGRGFYRGQKVTGMLSARDTALFMHVLGR